MFRKENFNHFSQLAVISNTFEVSTDCCTYREQFATLQFTCLIDIAIIARRFIFVLCITVLYACMLRFVT